MLTIVNFLNGIFPNYALPYSTKLFQGGYGIEDEMCVNYIHYYPQSNLEVCKSTVSKKTLDAFLTHV